MVCLLKFFVWYIIVFTRIYISHNFLISDWNTRFFSDGRLWFIWERRWRFTFNILWRYPHYSILLHRWQFTTRFYAELFYNWLTIWIARWCARIHFYFLNHSLKFCLVFFVSFFVFSWYFNFYLFCIQNFFRKLLALNCYYLILRKYFTNFKWAVNLKRIVYICHSARDFKLFAQLI